jgi:AraC-like DNA-binding protein/quercetin dioxygenase-like cupin family protein
MPGMGLHVTERIDGTGDLVADIVADIVAATRQGSVVYSRGSFHAPWGIGVPAWQMATFHVVTAGACWLTREGHDPIRLTRGDVVLVPSGCAHALVDSPDTPVQPVTDLIGGPLDTTVPSKVVLDGPGPATGLLCGGYLLDAGPRHPLTAALPAVLHLDAHRARGTGLTAAVDLLSDEVDRTDPGAPAVIAGLVDLLFVYVLRAQVADAGRAAGEGWMRAFHDPVVGGALALVRRDPGHPWTVTGLARAVGAPRATFSRRFSALTGQAPMTYVTAWRMTVASRLLREGQQPLREIAHRVGYDSEFAFARAFKRIVGHPPGRYRTAAAHTDQAGPLDHGPETHTAVSTLG